MGLFDGSNANIIILGAGSSVPYGFPTGKQLRKDILNLKNSIEGLQHLQEFEDSFQLYKRINTSESTLNGFYHKRITEFNDRFKKSILQSIDSYLNRLEKTNDPDNVNVGKYLIFEMIKKYERREFNNVGDNQDDWIEYLVEKYLKYDDIFNAFKSSPPLIITFNYDNIFEHYIHSYLVYGRNFTDKMAYEFIKNLNILHVHGHTKSYYSKYEETNMSIYEIISDLSVIRDEHKVKYESQVSKKIETVLVSTQKINIYFLGYGFDKYNNNLLFPNIKQFQGYFKANKIRVNSYSNNYANSFSNEEVSDIINMLSPLRLQFSSGASRCVDVLRMYMLL